MPHIAVVLHRTASPRILLGQGAGHELRALECPALPVLSCTVLCLAAAELTRRHPPPPPPSPPAQSDTCADKTGLHVIHGKAFATDLPWNQTGMNSFACGTMHSGPALRYMHDLLLPVRWNKLWQAFFERRNDVLYTICPKVRKRKKWGRDGPRRPPRRRLPPPRAPPSSWRPSWALPWPSLELARWPRRRLRSSRTLPSASHTWPATAAGLVSLAVPEYAHLTLHVGHSSHAQAGCQLNNLLIQAYCSWGFVQHCSIT